MLEQALEEPARRHGAADAIGVFCAGAKFDFQEHVPSFITASIPQPLLGPAHDADFEFGPHKQF